MKGIQPYVTKLKEKFKDDPKKMNEELMNLYKVQKVNPLGGCLPMVIQNTYILESLHHASGICRAERGTFYMVADGSFQTRYVIWSSTCNLSVHRRMANRPLPLLMGLTMFLQQKMTITDPQQKAFLLMPIFFTFIFLKFPSGLVLYWLTSNVITFAEHIFLSKKKT